MSTTYQDTFTGSGNLTGHVADSGFGTWGGPSAGRVTFALSSNRVVLEEGGTYSTFENAAGNQVAAYTSDADAYVDAYLPATAEHFYVLLQVAALGSFGFGYSHSAGSSGGILWDLYGLDGYWDYDESNPAGMVVGTAFRYGVVHDVVAGTTRPYSEPYGGGTRTYLGTAQANATPFSGQALRLTAVYGNVFSGGYLDNLTIVATNTTAAADPTTSTVALSGASAYIGHTLTATLTARDSGGALVGAGGETVVFGGTGFTAGATTDVGDGTYTATLTTTATGTAVASATIGGVTVSTTMPTATVLALPTSTSTGGFSPSTNFYVGRTATVTLTTPATGFTVAFSHTGGTGDVTFGATTDVGDGTYTATMTAVTGGTATTVTATIDGEAVTGSMPSVTVIATPTPAARGTTHGGALVYDSASVVTKWAKARQYALRFALGGAGRWQRIAVVHGATTSVSTSDVNYFALYTMLTKALRVKTRTDTF